DFHYQGHARGPTNAEEVEKVFGKMKVNTQVPDNYNYAFLSHYGMAELPGSDGQLVPRLEFRSTTPRGVERRAVVYVPSAKQFKLESLARETGIDRGYDSKLQVRFGKDFAYLTFFNGPNLDWLLDGKAARD